MNSQAGIDNTDAHTVSELITRLKSAFQEKEFEDVERILSWREEHLRLEIAHWKEKCEAMEVMLGELVLEKLLVDDQLQRVEQGFEALQKMYIEHGDRLFQLKERLDSFQVTLFQS